MKRILPFLLGSGLGAVISAIAIWQTGGGRFAIVMGMYAAFCLAAFWIGLLATSHWSLATFWAFLRWWYQRRFCGFTEAATLPGSRGTDWQEHWIGRMPHTLLHIVCRCGEDIYFTPKDYFVREQQHAPGCQGWLSMDHLAAPGQVIPPLPCGCPVTDARYAKVCPHCGLGHWMDASAKKVASG